MVLKREMKGFRFRPTDQELIEDYLNHKNLGDETLVSEAINEINICRFDPWDLRGQSKIQSEDDQVWYFFSPRDTKYANSKRSNRKTESGYWKATGRDRSIKGKNQKVIGTKKTLVFYRGRVPKGDRTAWVMHEYRSSTIPHDKGVYVLCKVKYKLNSDTSVSSGGGAEPSHPLPCSSEDHVTTEETYETIVQAEETPHSACDGGFETGLDLRWDELDQGSSLLHSMLLTDFSFIDDPPQSLFCDPMEDLEVASRPMSQFANPVLANQDDCSSETIHTLLNGQMQSNLTSQSCPDSSNNIDAETVSLWANQYSPRASAGEYTFSTM